MGAERGKHPRQTQDQVEGWRLLACTCTQRGPGHCLHAAGWRTPKFQRRGQHAPLSFLGVCGVCGASWGGAFRAP